MGSLIVPQIANPFLAVPVRGTPANTSNQTSFNVTDAGHYAVDDTITTYARQSTIEWAFLIVAIIAFLESLAFHFYQFCGQNIRNQDIKIKREEKELKSVKEMMDPKTCADGNRLVGFQLFLLLFLYFFQAVGGERIYGKFIRSFAIDQFAMDGDRASLLNSVFWIGFPQVDFLVSFLLDLSLFVF